jgi:hypothetical protein
VEYWEVVYRAIGDFGDLIAKAAAAKAALQDLGRAATAESAAETTGQTAAAAARRADSEAIKNEIADLAALKAAAEAANVQTAFGGRNTMDQHLADMAKELQYTDLLNRAHWLNFTSPQQAYAWQMQALNLKKLQNYADWAGYTTPDQYLSWLQKQRAELTSLDSVMLNRSRTYRELTSAALDYTNAIQGTHVTLGQLGEQGSIRALEASLAGLPGEVVTHVSLDDAGAIAKLAAYKTLLTTMPSTVTTTEVARAAGALGGVPLESSGPVVLGQSIPLLGNPASFGSGASLAQAAITGRAEAQAFSDVVSSGSFADELARVSAMRMTGRGAAFATDVDEAIGAALLAGGVPLSTPQALAAGGTIPGGGAPPPNWWMRLLPWQEAPEGWGSRWQRVSPASPYEQPPQQPPASVVQDHGTFFDALNEASIADQGGLHEWERNLQGLIDGFEELQAEERRASEGFGPNPQDAGAWEALAGEVHDAGAAFDYTVGPARAFDDVLQGSVITTVDDAIAHLQSLKVTSGDAAAKVAYAVKTLSGLSQQRINDQGLNDVQNIINLIGKTNDVAQASKLAYAAFTQYTYATGQAGQASERLGTDELVKLSAGFYNARKSADNAAAAVDAAGRGFVGLGSKFVLFGGAFGGNWFAGAVTGLHILISSVVDFLAVFIPAIGGAIIGVGAFAIAAVLAGNTVSALYNNLKAMNTVASATGASLGPFTGAMDALQSKIQPELWQLAGDVMLVLGHNTGVFATIAEKAGQILDDLGARITDRFIHSSGKGLLDFFNIGVRDAELFAHVLGSLYSAFMTLLKATETVQVSEHVLGILADTIGFLAKVLALIPTPVIAIFLALHATATYGGLVVTWVQQFALGITGLAARLPGAGTAALSFAQSINASSAQLENIAASSPAFRQLAADLDTSAINAARMQVYVQSLGLTMEQYATQTSEGARLMGQYGSGLTVTGREAVATGIALGGTEEQIAKIADRQAATPITALANAMGLSAAEAEKAATQFGAAGIPLTALAARTDEGAVKLATFGKGLDAAGQDAVALGVLMNATDGELAALATETEAATVEAGFFSKAMSGIGSVLAGNWPILVIAAAGAVAYFSYQALQATASVKNFVSNLNSSLSGANIAQAFVSLPKQIGEIQGQIDQATRSVQKSSTGFWNYIQAFALAITGNTSAALAPVVSQLKNLQLLQGQAKKDYEEFTNLSQAVGHLEKEGYNFSASLGILSAAGVQVTDTLSIMYVKVDALIQGYKLAGQSAGAIGEDMNVLNVNASSAVTSMQSLNQAWDSWQSAVQAPVSTFLTLNQSLTTFANDAQQAGASMTGLGKVIVSTATKSSGTNAAAQLQQDFQAVLGNVQQMFDAVRAAEALSGQDVGGQFTQTVKAAVDVLIPLAGKNKAAAAEISALAQEAGGPATLNLQQMAKWVGHIANPMQTLQSLTQGASISTYNLSQSAAQLTTSLQQELEPQMVQAILTASKVGPAMQGFADAVFSGHDSVQQLLPDATKLYDSLIKVTGTGPNAKSMFIAFAEGMHLSNKEANQLWAQVSKPLAIKVDTAGNSVKLKVLAKELGDTVTPQPPPQGLMAEIVNRYAKNWSQVYEQFMRNFGSPLTNFFTVTVPFWGKAVAGLYAKNWSQVYEQFMRNLGLPLTAFFTVTVPLWGKDIVSKYAQNWSQVYEQFMRNVGSPLTAFFTVTVPLWGDEIVSKYAQNWSHVYEQFMRNFGSPLTSFFTVLLPQSLDRLFTFEFPSWWDELYQNFMRDFASGFVNWWTTSFPNAMASGLNFAIGKVNGFISAINNDILSALPGNIHIGLIPKLASGGLMYPSGSVPGTGDEDGTHAVMMGGEWILRKPARMALQATYGPDFLQYLNQADTWLGSGSRGSAATQRPGPGFGRYASGGGIVGGILGGISSLVSGGATWLEGFAGWSSSQLDKIPGISGLLHLAKNGLASLFNGAWGEIVQPLVNAVPGTLSHGLAEDAAADIKKGIDAKLTSAQAAATKTVAASGGGASMSGGTVGQEEAYALSLFPGYGWGASQLSPLIRLWNQESGWNPNAVNASSGAYGIPQALPAAWGHPYALGDWRSQIPWGLRYIANRYGSPSGAWDHEVANNWYAGGGPVITALLNETGSTHIREAMALGSYLISRWNTLHNLSSDLPAGPYQGPNTKHAPGVLVGTSPDKGAWGINQKVHRGVTDTEAGNPVWAAKYMLPFYRSAVARVSGSEWKKDPMEAAMEAAREAEKSEGTLLSQPAVGTLDAAWRQVRDVLGLTAPTGPKGKLNEAQKFFTQAATAKAQWNTAYADYRKLITAKPKGETPARLSAQALADLRDVALWTAQYHQTSDPATRRKLQAESDAARKQAVADLLEVQEWNSWNTSVHLMEKDYAEAAGARNTIWGQVNGGDPANLTNADWDSLISDVNLWYAQISGKKEPPKSVWRKAGSTPPGNVLAARYFPGTEAAALRNVGRLGDDIRSAYYTWHEQWGLRSGAGRGTTGIVVKAPGQPTYSSDISQYIYGGPSSGAGPVGPGGYGFAGGGPVPSMAAMFAGGGNVPAPSFMLPGMSATMQKQLSGAAAAQLPRTLGDAAGTSVGLQVGSMTINNPVPEKPSQSIARASNRLAFLAGRGPV